ncbi:hypothetical protein KFU94_71050 [Chloroflexi bacterium TSY]|nr:hypothetical protein [Chloroflexi bacterium TSY]
MIDIENRRDVTRLLAILMIVAIGLRIVSALYQGNVVRPLPGIFDQVSYHGLAQRVIDGYGFSFGKFHWPATPAGEPTAHWSYLYTLYLASFYSLFGVQPLIPRLIQAILAGFLHCLFAFRLGKRVGGTTIGLLSAAISAGYIYFFFYGGALMTETFYIIAILWSFDVTFRLVDRANQRAIVSRNNSTPHRSGQKRNASSSNKRAMNESLPWFDLKWIELGMALSITLLFRQVFLLFMPFLLLWLWWQLASNNVDQNERSFWKALFDVKIQLPILKGMLLVAIVGALMILPWTYRNYRVFDTFVPLNTNSGFAFFWGNHPIYGTNFPGILPSDGPSYYDLIPKDVLHLNEAEMDQELRKRGFQFVIEDPKRYILLSISRLREYFKFWPSADSNLYSNIARVSSFGLLLPFMLYGLWRTFIYDWKSLSTHQRSVITTLSLFMLIYTTVHLLTWTLVRYRLPVDAILVIFAAIGLADLFQRFSSYTSGSQSKKSSVGDLSRISSVS